MQVCEKVFTRKDNLREHLRIHAGAPLRQKKKCHYCSKEFYTNQQLVIHERMHTGERPFECDLCTKTFLSSIALKKHRRIHTGEKPFECKFVSYLRIDYASETGIMNNNIKTLFRYKQALLLWTKKSNGKVNWRILCTTSLQVYLLISNENNF